MVTKRRFVIVFQSVFVVIFALGLLFPAGMVVKADDLPPADTSTTTEVVSPPEEPPPESGTTDTSAATDTSTTATDTTAAEAVVPTVVEETAAVEVVAPVEDPAVVPTEDPAIVPTEDPALVPTEDPLLVPAILPAPIVEAPIMDTPAEVLEALPEEAELVVLDEAGVELPLVSVEAAETVATGDPQWCPGTGAPNSGGCISYGTIKEAVDHAQLAGNGNCTIYVESIYANPATNPLVINGSSFADSGFNMFLLGGYDMTTGTVVGTSSVSQTFSISNITGSLTLANFIITEFTNNSAVKIANSANVTLNNITINENKDGDGITVDNSHSVTIKNSKITEKDKGYGVLMINGSHDIMLLNTDVDAYGRDGGIYMNNVHDVVLNTMKVNSFDGCGGGGCIKDAVYVYGSQDIKLTGVTAYSQFGNGFYSKNGSGYLSLIDSIFDKNLSGHGVLVENNNGTIVLEEVSASGNGREGVEIQNSHGSVTITDSDILKNLGDYGLWVNADTIEIGGTHVDSNARDGASLYADDWMTLKNSTFDGNGHDGLWAESDEGTMLLEYVTAIKNGWKDPLNHSYGYGMYLNSHGDMTLKNVIASGNFNYGIKAETDGKMDISDSNFDSNGWGKEKNHDSYGGWGAHLISALDMTITDTTFNHNYNEGLYAKAGSESEHPKDVFVMLGEGHGPPPTPIIGNILLDGVTADYNGYTSGESSHEGNGFAYGAKLETNGTLTILKSSFSENRDYGVNGDAWGAIKVEKTNVNTNWGEAYGDYGAFFHGDSSIELLNSNFNDNYGPGLQVYVTGDIKADGISASDNDDWYGWYAGYGAVLDTKFGSATVANSFFDNNDGFGLILWADDDITINNISADGNKESGFWSPAVSEALFLLGGEGGGGGWTPWVGYFNGGGAFIHSKEGSVVINNSTFDKNEGDGLDVEAEEDITLFKVSASGNGHYGAELKAHGNISVTCSTFMDNGVWGMESGATGLDSTVTLNSVTFGGNGFDDHNNWAGDLIVNLGYPCGGGTPTGPGAPIMPGPLTGVIPVTGGQFMALSCDGISVVQLKPDLEATIFNQPMCGYSASMEKVTTEDLPGKLPDGRTYEDGFTVTLMFGNEVVTELPTGATDTLVFPISEDQAKSEFHMLFWDTSAGEGLGDWIDLGGVKEALKWVKTHNKTGTFLLVL